MNRDQETLNFVQKAPSHQRPIPGVFALLAQSWRLFTSRPMLFLGMGCILMPSSIILNTLLSKSHVLMLKKIVTTLPYPYQVLSFSVFILFFAFHQLAYTALIFAIKNHSDTKRGIANAFRNAFSIVFSSLSVGILTTAFTLAGALLFIIPGILLYINFLFAPYVLVNERQYSMEALTKSWYYVTGYWWRTLYRHVVASLFATTLTIFIFSISLVSGGSIIISLLLYIFLTPLKAIYLFLLYLHLKHIKEEEEESQSDNNGAE